MKKKDTKMPSENSFVTQAKKNHRLLNPNMNFTKVNLKIRENTTHILNVFKIPISPFQKIFLGLKDKI